MKQDNKCFNDKDKDSTIGCFECVKNYLIENEVSAGDSLDILLRIYCSLAFTYELKHERMKNIFDKVYEIYKEAQLNMEDEYGKES